MNASVCVIASLLGVSVCVLNHSIKSLDTKINDIEHRIDSKIQGSVCLFQAKAIEAEMFREYASKKLDKLRIGLDSESNAVLDYVLDAMIYTRFLKGLYLEKTKLEVPKSYNEHLDNWKLEFETLKNKFQLPRGAGFAPEVFYFHHGLRFADKRIKNYIRNKDIIDCGAFVGDSVLVLKDYTDANIYCYEFSKSNIAGFHETMNINSVKSKYALIPVALGDSAGSIDVLAEKSINSGRSLESGIGYRVEQTTIDAEAKKRNFNVGFIKADVEGDGFRVVKGAIETIKSHRPVLSLCVYHNSEELFEIKPFLEKHLKDYIFEFKLQNFTIGDIVELMLLCYPKELLENEIE